MACIKYTLTNTGSTLVNFNYRRCDDSLWEYQIELNPNQTKNIWLIDNTYSIAPSFSSSVSLINLGTFPEVSATQTQTPTQSATPTPTPTNTGTPTQTPTNTETPTQTPTNTETPTNTPTPTNTGTPTPTQTPTNTETPTNTPTPTNTETPTQTPTNTQTQTPTNTETPTPTTSETPTNTPTPTTTETSTPTPTPTFGYYTYSLGTGATSNDACIDFGSAPNTIYGTVSGGIGPNVGEYLYYNTELTIPVINGYFSNGTAWYQVTGDTGQITSSDPNGC